jgi:starvation-inducible DNA-binding protein
VQVGGHAEVTIQTAAQRCTLQEYAPNITAQREHVDALSSALAVYGKSAIERSEELGDKDTADIFTEISRCIDKYLWFVEEHM